jgi:maleylacetoacetate isomerase
MKLYTYWRSTSSYRLRIALALKNLSVEPVFVHLLRNGGEQNSPAFRAINPQGRLPVLQLDDGEILTQSPAIIEYLEEAYPLPALLPKDPKLRAQVRAVAATIGCDIHPLHNVGPLKYLKRQFGRSETEIAGWIAHWLRQGFSAVEARIGDTGYCFGDEPGLADVYLVPQLYAARRFNVELDDFPRILRVEHLAADHPAVRLAHPSNQPDAE